MTLNCNGKILDLSTKKIMGIVNVSNDSFTTEVNIIQLIKLILVLMT